MVELVLKLIYAWGHIKLHAPFFCVIITTWTTSPIIAYAAVQCVKLYRREFKLRRLFKIELRILGGIIAGVWGFRASVVWNNLDFSNALLNSVFIGFVTPYIVAIYFWWVNKRAPELAIKLTIPNRRLEDKNPEDTGEFKL